MSRSSFRTMLFVPLAVMVGFLLSSNEAGAQRAMTIQVNHEMGVGTPVARALEWLGQAVTKEAKGAVVFRFFHTHELGSERETYDMLQSGAVEMAVSGGQIVSRLAPEYGALLLPFAFSDADHFARVLNGTIGQEMHKRFLQRKGIRILGWSHRAPRHITTSDREIHKPSDMKGLRIRIREIPVQIDAFRALGTSPVPMAFGEVYTGLQTGTIHAQENPVSIMFANNFQEVQKFIILTSHIREAFWWEISEKVWQRMTPEIRAAFEKHIGEAIKLANQWEFEEDNNYLVKFEAAGVKPIRPTREALAEYARLVEPVAAQYTEKWEKGVYEELVRLR